MPLVRRDHPPTDDPEDDRLLRPRDAAAMLGLAEPTLRAWRCQGRGPQYVRIGRNIFYRRRDLIAFVCARLHDPTKASGTPADAAQR